MPRKARKGEPPRRIQISVPSKDKAAWSWLEAQDNISTSLRILMHRDVIKNGYTDVLSRDVQQELRGRPSTEKTVTERAVEEVQQTVTEVKKPPKVQPKAQKEGDLLNSMVGSESSSSEDKKQAMFESLGV